MSHLTAADTVSAPSTRAPSSGQRKGQARPAQLDDIAWLRKQTLLKSARQIARELGVHERTVRAACRRLGITLPLGRRRGNLRLVETPKATVTQLRPKDELPHSVRLIAARYAADDVHGIPPTWEQILLRLKAADTARRNHDRAAEADAAINLAAAAARLATQLTQAPA